MGAVRQVETGFFAALQTAGLQPKLVSEEASLKV